MIISRATQAVSAWLTESDLRGLPPKDPLDDDDENEQEKEEDEEDDEPALAEGWGRAGLRLSNTQCSFHLPNGGKRAFCRIAV